MEKRIWKIRIEKNYPEATNHIVLGEVIKTNLMYIEIKCKVFHFKKPTASSSIFTSQIKTRIFPWHTVSYITVLDSSLNWEETKVVLNKTGDIIINVEENNIKIGTTLGKEEDKSWVDH